MGLFVWGKGAGGGGMINWAMGWEGSGEWGGGVMDWTVGGWGSGGGGTVLMWQ